MRPLIVLLAASLLAGCTMTPDQKVAANREARQAAAAKHERISRESEMIVQACERSGYPRGTAENIQCSMDLLRQMKAMQTPSRGGMTSANAAYQAFTRGLAHGERARSEPPEQRRVILSPY